MPIKQFFKRQNNWYEKFVDLENPKDIKFNEVKTNIKLTEEKLNFEISKEQNVIEYSPDAFKYLKIIGTETRVAFAPINATNAKTILPLNLRKNGRKS